MFSVNFYYVRQSRAYFSNNNDNVKTKSKTNKIKGRRKAKEKKKRKTIIWILKNQKWVEQVNLISTKILKYVLTELLYSTKL